MLENAIVVTIEKSSRTYGQLCPLARGLDVLGERWTLLLVRELLIGPRRYSDLLAGLPGIGTNLLAARLRSLEAAGVVRRATLPPPAGSAVYELTEWGRELEPAVLALARWGARTLPDAPADAAMRAEWLVLTLRGAFSPERAGDVDDVYELRVDGATIGVRVAGGEIETWLGPADEPDAVVETDVRTLLELGAGRLDPVEADRSGRARLRGRRAAVRRCFRVLALPG